MHRGGLLTRSSNPSREGTVQEKPFFMGDQNDPVSS